MRPTWDGRCATRAETCYIVVLNGLANCASRYHPPTSRQVCLLFQEGRWSQQVIKSIDDTRQAVTRSNLAGVFSCPKIKSPSWTPSRTRELIQSIKSPPRIQNSRATVNQITAPVSFAHARVRAHRSVVWAGQVKTSCISSLPSRKEFSQFFHNSRKNDSRGDKFCVVANGSPPDERQSMTNAEKMALVRSAEDLTKVLNRLAKLTSGPLARKVDDIENYLACAGFVISDLLKEAN
jgi:hypothetical protein